MKMTMHIDEAVLEEVMETFGYETKTDAVNTALKEMIRKKKLAELSKTGLGLTKAELMDAFDPDYDPDSNVVCIPEGSALAAEETADYKLKGTKADGETDPS